MTCLLEARDLRHRYPDGREALQGIDLRVTHGERVAVLGPNGAGKTTFVFHLNGLLRGTGRLHVTGITVADKTVRELRARVGLVFQDPDDQLFMPTVREDVAFGPLNQGLTREEALARVDEALAAVRMRHAADRAPHQLSMGERRRVAIATVLAMRPELLVLDDVRRTMLVVTHDLPFAAELCERAVILSAGRVVADGPCATVLADEELLARHDLELPRGFDPERVAGRTIARSPMRLPGSGAPTGSRAGRPW